MYDSGYEVWVSCLLAQQQKPTRVASTQERANRWVSNGNDTFTRALIGSLLTEKLLPVGDLDTP